MIQFSQFIAEQKKRVALVLSIVCIALIAVAGYFLAQSPKPLRILWAEWEPSKALREISKEFTAKTGIPVEVIEVSWADFQTVAYRDLDRTYPEYDIIIGDSQWLGRNVERGERYVDLTSFIEKNNLKEHLVPGSLEHFGEYPQGSGRYYAVPILADGMGFAYRKDLFESPKERAAFRARYGRELLVPKTWNELRDITKFFYRPKENLFGISMPTSVEYDALTMTFENIFFSFGGEWGDTTKFMSDGFVNNKKGVTALEFFKQLYMYSAQHAGGSEWYTAPVDDFKGGRTALALDYFTFYPSLADKVENPYAAVTGYFIVPEGPGGRFAALGGQGASIVYHSNNKRAAKKFLEWWITDDAQLAWARRTGITLDEHVFNDADVAIADVVPFGREMHDTIRIMKDFWVAPEYPELLDASQRVLHEYLITKNADAKQTLDTLAEKWNHIFKTSPYNILREE